MKSSAAQDHDRSQATREQILHAAERLFAQRGIDGISMRQLAIETGQANNSAIQYHFGDKAGLLREIIARRVAAFEPRRQAMWAQAAADGILDDSATLLAIVFLPIAEATDEDGRHNYAALLSQFLTRTQYEPGFSHPGWAEDSAARKAATRLMKLRPDLGERRFARRMNQLNGLLVSALVDRDNARAHGRADSDEEDFLQDLLGMMAAAFNAPPPSARRRKS